MCIDALDECAAEHRAKILGSLKIIPEDISEMYVQYSTSTSTGWAPLSYLMTDTDLDFCLSR